MGAKYAELTEFTKTSRLSLEAEGFNINAGASLSALRRLGIISLGFEVGYDVENLQRSFLIYLKLMNSLRLRLLMRR